MVSMITAPEPSLGSYSPGKVATAATPADVGGSLPTWRTAAGVFVIAACARLIHGLAVAETPFFEGLVIDALTYDRLASAMAGSGDGVGAFYQPPLYPAFLAAAKGIGFASAWDIALLQIVAGSLTAALLVPITARLAAGSGLDRLRVGAMGGLFVALLGPLVLFDVERLPPSIVHLALVLAWWWMLVGPAAIPRRSPATVPVDRRVREAARSRSFPMTIPWRLGEAGGDLVAGFLVGAATVGWTLSIVFAPALLAMRAMRSPGVRDRGVMVVLFLVGLTLPVAAVANHNARHDGDGVLVSYNGGLNLWLGNNPNWRATWRARPGAAFEPELERPDREGVTTPEGRSRYFINLVVTDIARRPTAALTRTAEKFFYVAHGREIRRNQDLGTLRESSWLLRGLMWEGPPFFPFGLLLPLACFGLLVTWRRTATPIIAATALMYGVALAGFFVASRYRLPLLLWLAPHAALGLSALFVHARSVWGWVGRRAVAAEVIGFGNPAWIVLLGTFLVCNLPVPFTATFADSPTEAAILRAQALRSAGRLAEAGVVAARVASDHPEDANAQMLAAELDLTAGDCQAALPRLRAVARLSPRASTPWALIGRCATRGGRVEEAEHAYAAVLARHPFHAEGLKGAALLYMDLGDRQAAIAMLQRFIAAGYRDDGVRFDLGRLLVETGRLDEARAVLTPLRIADPSDADVTALLRRAGAAIE